MTAPWRATLTLLWACMPPGSGQWPFTRKGTLRSTLGDAKRPRAEKNQSAMPGESGNGRRSCCATGRQNPGAGVGVCMGPGRAPGGKWLIDAEGDGEGRINPLPSSYAAIASKPAGGVQLEAVTVYSRWTENDS